MNAKWQPSEFWTNDDWIAGHCSCEEIGQSKYTSRAEPPQPTPEPEPIELIAELPPSTMAELKQAALRVARGKMGFDKFFEAYPGFHHKFLLSMVKEPPPPQRQDLTVNISWLTSDRLSYKNQSQLELVQEVAKPAAWKSPPDTQGLAAILRDTEPKP